MKSLGAWARAPVPSHRRCRRALVALVGWAALAIPSVACAADVRMLRLARLEDIPDQLVGGEILQSAYRRLGIELEFVDLPARRALIESSQGRLDGEVHRILAVRDEFASLIAIHPSINHIEPSAFVKSREFAVAGWPSIAAYSVGIVRGVGSSERGTKGMPRVEAAATMDQLMQMLAKDRIEVAVNDRFSGTLVIRRLGLDAALRPLSPPFERIALHHFLHERHRDLVPRIEQVLRDMADRGDLERMRLEITTRMLRDAGR